MTDSERKLVTIRKISEIKPIENSDNIELAVVDGWQCVVKKGEFHTGNVGVFYEIDSFLPLEERYSFLKHKRKNADETEGYRLKTAKFRGALSQGLLLPLSLFPELDLANYNGDIPITLNVGDDLTEILNVKKFELPIPAQLVGLMKGGLPGFLHKTDQERIQNLPEYFTIHKQTPFEESEKIDGTSSTYYLNNSEFGVCSRNLELKESEGNTYWKIARELNIEEKLSATGRNLAIQGEIAGEGINKNPLKLKGIHFFVFDVWDIDKGKYLIPFERRELIKNMNLKHVPIIDPHVWSFEKYDTMEKMIEHASGKSLLNPEVEREGIVFKSEIDVSFKVVSNSYLLKEKD